MTSPFAPADWLAMGAYVALLFGAGWWFTPKKSEDVRDYFLADRQIPVWLAAASVLSAQQSAATFLGGPDYGYRTDFTYLGTSLSALISAIFVARFLIPRFYAAGVTTVYELLEQRFSRAVSKAAGGLFLGGRVLAGGARIYLAAIAVSMVMFAEVSPQGVIVAALLIVAASFLFTFVGGLKSVIWNDLVQLILYVGAAVGVLGFLYASLDLPFGEILRSLHDAPGGQDKLKILDFTLDPARPFAFPALLTGVALLYIGNNGLDQDTTQRLLACKDARSGARSLYLSVLATLPLTFIFLAIGELLYLFYNQPHAVAGSRQMASSFDGQKITVFMHYILTELPPGLRGLTTIGVIAAAIATTNSALNAMSSVIIQDFYRPWRERSGLVGERHFVLAGRVGMAVTGLLMFATAVLSFYWQRYTSMPLLEFALSVMTFAYAGLLGVYFTAILTKRGSSRSAILALAIGFLATVALQAYVIDVIGLPPILKTLSFPWQLLIATALATLTCLMGRPDGRTMTDGETL